MKIIFYFTLLFCLFALPFWDDEEDEDQKTFQKSYSVAMFGDPASISNADIAYGYIMYNHKRLTASDSSLQTALKSIWDVLCGKEKGLTGQILNHPWSEMKLDNINILFARSQQLRYTSDGEHWDVSRSFKTGQFERVVMGENYFVTFTAPDNKNMLITHNVTISKDREDHFYLFHHSFTPLRDAYDYFGTLHFFQTIDRLTRRTIMNRVLRIVSYNAWNTMPATWFRTGRARFEWYYKRMQLISKYIHENDPDIIVFQEIRYDETLGDADHRFQLRHLSDLLPEYQYVYQPANMYVERSARVEEGVAIFSKFPILRQDYIILSRDYEDKQDDHQRVVLHATIQIPYLGNIHVYGTHLSLSEKARDRTVLELSKFIDQNSKNAFSVFCGDLNAEPDSRAIQYLIGKGELEGKRTDYKDAFLQIHPEPVPRSPAEGTRKRALTFPTDNPVKRIDYIIYKQGDGNRVTVRNSQLFGIPPLEGTETDDLTAGMQSDRSSIWASDHRGVYADFVF